MPLNQKYEFALFYDAIPLAHCHAEQLLTLRDPRVVHRITRVLRLHIGDSIILFDRSVQLGATVKRIEKKEIILATQEPQAHQLLTPSITFGIPLLKQDHLEQAIYNATEAGINNLQLLITSKSRQRFTSPKELERITRVIIAAAE